MDGCIDGQTQAKLLVVVIFMGSFLGSSIQIVHPEANVCMCVQWLELWIEEEGRKKEKSGQATITERERGNNDLSWLYAKESPKSLANPIQTNREVVKMFPFTIYQQGVAS